MTETPGPSDEAVPTAPPAPPAPPAAPLPPAPAPPPLDPKYTPEVVNPRRPARKVAGVVVAVLIIAVKLAFAFGAGHLLSGSSGPVVVIVVACLILFGFLTRFLRL